MLKLRCEKQGEVCFRRKGQHKQQHGQRHSRRRARPAPRWRDFFLTCDLRSIFLCWALLRTCGGRLRHNWEGIYMPRNLDYILEASTFFKFSGAAQIRHTFYITTWCTHICIYNWKKRLQNNTCTFCIRIFSISYFWMFDANPMKWFHEPLISCIGQLLSPAMGHREARELFHWELMKSRKFRMIILAAKWEVDWSWELWNQGSLLEATVHQRHDINLD